MIVPIRIKDDTHLQYAGYDGNSPQRAIERQVERFKDFSPTDRALLLSHKERRDLEALYGTPIDSGRQIVEWVTRLKGMDIEGLTFFLSPPQVKRVEDWAFKSGRPLKEWLKWKLQEGINYILMGA